MVIKEDLVLRGVKESTEDARNASATMGSNNVNIGSGKGNGDESAVDSGVMYGQ